MQTLKENNACQKCEKKGKTTAAQCNLIQDTEMQEDGDGACGNDMNYVPEEESGEESGGEDDVQFENVRFE